MTVLAQSPVFRGDKGVEPAGRMQLRVLAQGVILTEHNLAGNLVRIEAELKDFENELAMVYIPYAFHLFIYNIHVYIATLRLVVAAG